MSASGAGDGVTVSYHVVVELLPEPVERLDHVLIGQQDGGLLYDALHDREVTDDWLTILDGKMTVAGLEGHRLGTEPLPFGVPSLVMTAEQSNTSLVFGDALVLKVYRRPHAGLHPDVEIHAALARAGCPHIAQPYGWIESRAGTFAFAQEFLSGGVEGWELARGSVRDLLREGDLHADEVGGDFAAEAERLGEVTAEVHSALREVLPTATWGPAELAERAARLQAFFQAAMVAVPGLEGLSKGIGHAYDELAHQTEPVAVQRVHGDLHLGQTMRVADGWRLLDFEGEPVRSMEERRALDSPQRDIAGMLRSFDYAAHQMDVEGMPLAQASYRAAEWSERNRAAFCAGYARASGRDPRADEVLLRAYEIDKAVYEVVYEAQMRPSWVPIPMGALERLAS